MTGASGFQTPNSYTGAVCARPMPPTQQSPGRLAPAHQDVAYSTKTLAAREMALRASLDMLTPSGSCEKGGGEQRSRPRTCSPSCPLVRPSCSPPP